MFSKMDKSRSRVEFICTVHRKNFVRVLFLQSFVKITPLRKRKISLSLSKSCPRRKFFSLANMSFNATGENKILQYLTIGGRHD